MAQAAEIDSRTEKLHGPEPVVLRHGQSDGGLFALQGDWLSETVGPQDAVLREIETTASGDVHIDLSGIGAFDTAGAWMISRTRAGLMHRGHAVWLDNAEPRHASLIEAISDASKQLDTEPRQKRTTNWLRLFEVVGRLVFAFWRDFQAAMHILGATFLGAQMKAGRGRAIKWTAIVHQIDRMGVGAIPVVLLMSTIVGAIIAQQGIFQLRYFGSEVFVVDLVGILVLRELGVLLTAIMVAGRSGSAITAEIGSMKMREEIDALTVIGLNPVGVLVFPRLVALVIAMPLLTVVANAAALGGAMFVAWVYAGISPEAFIVRLRDAIDLTSIFSGLIKAPFMAMIIGILAAVEGMKVGGSAESLGRRVTASVVKAIFVVIVVDGLFAIFYAAIDF